MTVNVPRAKTVRVKTGLLFFPTGLGENLPVGFLQGDVDDPRPEAVVRGLYAASEGGVRLAEQELAL